MLCLLQIRHCAGWHLRQSLIPHKYPFLPFPYAIPLDVFQKCELFFDVLFFLKIVRRKYVWFWLCCFCFSVELKQRLSFLYCKTQKKKLKKKFCWFFSVLQNRKLKDDGKARRRERHKVKNNEFMEYHVVFLFLASCLNSQIFYNFHHTYA